MLLLLAFLLLGSPPAISAEKLAVEMTIAPGAGSTAPGVEALQAGVGALFTRAYGRFAEISFEAQAEEATSADGGPVSAPSAQVEVRRQAGALLVTSSLTEGNATRSLQSLVPEGAPASLVATMTGDLAFLLFSRREFSAFPLAPPPRLTGILALDSLSALTGWGTEELEPIGLAGSGDELTVCFPHHYLTLGPLYRIGPATLQDIDSQAAGPEPLQLSGVARDGDARILFSEKQRTLAVVDARSGARRLIATQELSALPARRLAPGTLAILSDAGGAPALTVISLDSGRRWMVRPRASYVSAFCADGEGNLWVWDAGERRVRIFTPGGMEIYAIKPLFPASTLQLPQQIEVYADGSFLLGGSGEVWKFENSGIPAWRLTRIPGRPSELLPSLFALAASGSDGTFTILDGPSRRLLSFAPGPMDADGSLGSLLSRMNRRNAAQVQEAADRALGEGLSLMAWQLGDLLARRGGAETDLLAARASILKQKASLYADLAESLMRDLRYDRAEGAFLRAAEAARELAAESPEDPEAAELLTGVVSRRQEVRAALARQAEAPRVLSARGRVQVTRTCERLLVVRLQVRNDSAVEMTRVAVRLSLPSLASMPSQAAIETLAPRAQREMTITLGLRDSTAGVSPGQGLAAGLLISFQRGREEVTVPSVIGLSLAETAAAVDAADPLLCRVRAGDPLIAGLGDDLLAGAHDALPALAGILDGLGALRSASAQPAADPDPSPRSTLRSLSPDENQWTVLAISTAAALGLPAGVLRWPDRALALVDTGIPLSKALASVPGLGRFSAALGAISRDGDLCIPLSGLPAAESGGAETRPRASVQALREALRLCSARGVGGARVSWLDAAAARTQAPLPIPFPFLLPIQPRRVDEGTMIDGLDAALSAAAPPR
jgi:hypothetical protein